MKRESIRAIAPLQSWDIFSEFLMKDRLLQSKENDIAQIEIFKNRYNWSLASTFLKHESYTTLVITNYDQHIIWVNAGFSEMTGYPKSYAVGKHPRFLQGKNTSPETRKDISAKITKHEIVHKQLINYRKDGSEYVCDIKIIPLRNNSDEITHFIALERTLRSA